MKTCKYHGTPLNGEGECLACQIAEGKYPAPNEEYLQWAKSLMSKENLR